MREIQRSWIEKAAKGNRHAMDRILSECENPVYHIALGILADPQDAADASQQALLNIYRGLAQFRFECAFSSWVYRIAFRCCVDIQRKRRDIPIDPLEGQGLLERNAEAGVAERIEQKTVLKQALQRLPEEMRQALVLREYCDYSYEEIARLLKIEVGTVKSRLSRARQLLKKRLLEMGYFGAGQGDGIK